MAHILTPHHIGKACGQTARWAVTRVIAQAQFGGKTADLEYSCDGQVTSIAYTDGSRLTFFDHTHATGTRVLNVMRDHRNSVVGAYDADTDHVVGRAHYNADGRMMTFDTDAAAYATSDIQSVDCQEVGTFDGICEAPGGVPFAFNSMWRSPATGMVYMRNRVYDPRLGQFLSHDPLGYVDSHNLYQYGLFDPINYWDPYGLFGWKEANQAWNAVNDVASDVVGAKDQIAENMGAAYMETTASALDSVGITDGAAREFFDTTRSAAAAGIEGVANTGGGLLVAPAEVVVAMDDSSEDMKDGMQQASNAESAEDYAEATGKFSKGVLKGAAIGGLGGKAKRTKGPKTRTETPDSKRAPNGKTSNEASDATTTKQSQNDKTQNSANGSGKQKPGGCFAAGTPVVVAGELLPIEQVEVGQRVSQYNDGVCDDLRDPDPETCVVVELELDEPTHASKRLRATLMRDAAWLKANANNGRIWLGFDEINAEGWSRIESVSSCPVIEPGEGCLVTGTFTHLNDDVMALRFEELEETVHVTSLHPLYSLDRDRWLNVRDIETGERLASKAEGWLTVSSLEPLHETMQVFNIEVQGDHEYLVFGAGLRSHNADECRTEPKINEQKQAGHVPGKAQNINRKKQGKGTSEFFGKKSGDRATQIAAKRGTPVPNRPNVVEYEFGVAVGTGPNGGMRTKVRVHKDRRGQIHGHPAGPERFR